MTARDSLLNLYNIDSLKHELAYSSHIQTSESGNQSCIVACCFTRPYTSNLSRNSE